MRPRAFSGLTRRFRFAVRAARIAAGGSGFFRQERSAERGEFFRGVPLDEMLAARDEVQVEFWVELHRERGAFRSMAAVLFPVDHSQRRPHFGEPLPKWL